jgi:hypothetical protein
LLSPGNARDRSEIRLHQRASRLTRPSIHLWIPYHIYDVGHGRIKTRSSHLINVALLLRQITEPLRCSDPQRVINRIGTP